jgi:hypothetical protein
VFRAAFQFLFRRCGIPIASVVLLCLAGCGNSNGIRTSFSVAGPCSACPPSRLEAELERLDDIDEALYNPQTGDLVVQYQPGNLSRSHLRELILDLGYTVDGEYPLTTTLATCCDASRGIDELLQDPDDLDYNLDDANYEHQLEADSDSMLNQLERELDRTLQSGPQNATAPQLQR